MKSQAVSVAASASTEPTDRSMPPEMTTAVMPTARIPFSATWRRMSVRFPMSRKTGRPPRTGEKTTESSKHGREAEEAGVAREPAPSAAARGGPPGGPPPGLLAAGSAAVRSRRRGQHPLLGRFGVRQLGRHAALAEDQHPVALRQDLRHLGRAEDDPEALRRRAGGAARRPRPSRRGRSRASARRAAGPTARRRGSARGSPSAGCRRRASRWATSGDAARTPVSRMSEAPASRGARPVDPARDATLSAGTPTVTFSDTDEVREDRLRLALLGKENDAGVARLGRRGRTVLRPADEDASRHGTLERPRQGEEQLRAARPDQAGEAQDLAAAKGQRDVRQAPAPGALGVLDREVLDPEDLRRARLERRQLHALDVAADHQADHLVLVDALGLARDDALPVAQHRDPVRQAPHLVELVGDVDDGDPALGEATDQALEPRGLRGREGRRRLVHDDEARVERQRPRDRDELALPRLEPPDGFLRRNVRFAESLERLRGPRQRATAAGRGRCSRRPRETRRAAAPGESPRSRPRSPRAGSPCAAPRRRSGPRPRSR